MFRNTLLALTAVAAFAAPAAQASPVYWSAGVVAPGAAWNGVYVAPPIVVAPPAPPPPVVYYPGYAPVYPAAPGWGYPRPWPRYWHHGHPWHRWHDSRGWHEGP